MRSCAEDTTGLKALTENVDFFCLRTERMVEERSCQRRSSTVRSGGASGSENVGISNVSSMKNRTAEYPRFPKPR